MNPRILKKLTKRAAPLIEVLGGRYSTKFTVDSSIDDTLETFVKMDKKHLCKFGYPKFLKGTIGFGDMIGYYEREWSDLDAYSMLKEFVEFELCTWEKAKLTGYPEYDEMGLCCDQPYWPKSMKFTPRFVFQQAEILLENRVKDCE